MKAMSAIAVAAVAGMAAGASADVTGTKIRTLKGETKDLGKTVKVAGEVYMGASGEMVLIPEGSVRPNLQNAGATEPLWICSNFNDPCGDLVPGSTGDGIGSFLGIDSGTDTDGDGLPEGTFTDIAAVDSGDLPFDSFVCGMRAFIGSTEPTPDTDGDSAPDSLASSTVVFTFVDNDDGFGFGASFGTAVTSLGLSHFGDSDPNDAYIEAYFFTLDFTTDFVDGTGNPIDASFTIANTATTSDVDGDGLGDWGWQMEFEWTDTNSDGNNEVWGSLTLMAPPVGDVIDNGDPFSDFNYTVENVVAPNGTGAAEGIDIYTTDPLGVAAPVYLGTIPGFTSEADPDGVPGSGDEFAVRGMHCELGTPYAQLALDLFTAGEDVCEADFNGDGFFNNTDINLFVAAFLGNDPQADINGDGFWNNTDINLFVSLFLSQCQ